MNRIYVNIIGSHDCHSFTQNITATTTTTTKNDAYFVTVDFELKHMNIHTYVCNINIYMFANINDIEFQ